MFGHHHLVGPRRRPPLGATYFGINPDDSEALRRVVRRRENIVGYFAGHTHRNRVRRFAAARDVPFVEVGVHEGLPGRVGRVPDLRGRLHADRPADRRARRDGVDRADPADVRRPLPRLRARPASTTAASPSASEERRPSAAGVEVRHGVGVGGEEVVGPDELGQAGCVHHLADVVVDVHEEQLRTALPVPRRQLP